MLRGSDEIVAYLENRLGIRLGESTPDGRIYLKREEECLAACCGAPMMMEDHTYHENLTPEKVGAILDRIEAGEKDMDERGVDETGVSKLSAGDPGAGNSIEGLA